MATITKKIKELEKKVKARLSRLPTNKRIHYREQIKKWHDGVINETATAKEYVEFLEELKFIIAKEVSKERKK